MSIFVKRESRLKRIEEKIDLILQGMYILNKVVELIEEETFKEK